MSSRDRDDRRSSRDDDSRGRGRDRDEDRRGDSRDRGRDDRDSGDRGRRDDDRRGSRDREDDRSSGRGSAYVYRQRSADEVNERASKGARDYDKLLKPGSKMLSPKDGENRFRICPPTWDGANHYGVDVFVHYGVGPDRESYICPRAHSDGAPCPICEERDRARREDRPDEEYIKELEPRRRVLVWAVDRDNEREGVQAWMMPWTVDKDIVKVSVDKSNGEVLPIDHPEDGYDVTFDKTGKGMKTKYEGVAIARRSSPLGKSSFMDYVVENPLPDQLQIYSYDHIAKTFGAQGQQRDTRSRDRDDRDDRDDRGGSRDRDDRDRDDRGRDRDRDDRGRGDDRDDKDRDDRRSRDRDRDERPARGRGEPELSWSSIHDMTRTELEDLIEQKDLDIKPSQAKDDGDLADWVCEEMKLEKDEAPARRRTTTDDRGDERLRDMRERRERG